MNCGTSECCTQGYALKTILNLMNMVHGPSIITISPTGAGSMHQTCMPMPLEFQCTAYACEFPGQSTPPLSLGEKAAVGITGGLIFVVLVIVVIAVFVQARKQKQRYLQWGNRRLHVTLSWSNLSCVLKLDEGKELTTVWNVSGHALPGTVVALLGESGAGKTSLLDMLAGRKTVGVLGGDIRANGRDRGKDWKRLSGYVMQGWVCVKKRTNIFTFFCLSFFF